MAGPDIDTALDWRGREVVDRDDEKVGTLREIYLDESERPAWASVHTALFGLRQTFVPLSTARLVDDRVQVPYLRDHVKDAPSVDPDLQLSAEEEERLYRHYGLSSGESEDRAAGGEPPGAVAHAEREPEREPTGADGGARESDDDAMTRSEEEVTIGTRRRVRGRARLRKYVVTDYVEKKIPVRREEVRLEREPAEGEEPPPD